MISKEDKLFYSISEVSKKIGVTTQTIRNWVSDFPQLKVRTDKNKRRFFTKNNIEVLKKIDKFRKDGYEINAIKKMFSKKVDKNIENIIIRIDSLINRIDKIV